MTQQNPVVNSLDRTQQPLDERYWLPTGARIGYVGTAPKGWLKLDGSVVKIKQYFPLYRQLKAAGVSLSDSTGIFFTLPTVADTIIKV